MGAYHLSIIEKQKKKQRQENIKYYKLEPSARNRERERPELTRCNKSERENPDCGGGLRRIGVAGHARGPDSLRWQGCGSF